MMKTSRLFVSAAAIILSASTAVHAATLHVSAATGGSMRKADGSKEKPWRDLQAALDRAQAGDTILVAAGNYLGTSDQGFLKMTIPVNIMGGYTDDFSSRDVLKNLTMVQPTTAQNGTSRSFALLSIGDPSKPRSFNAGDGGVTVDGIVFDRGFSNGYHPTKGKPKDVETGMLVNPPGQGINGDAKNVATIVQPLIYFGNGFGNVTIRNCTFANSGNYAIRGSWSQGKVVIENNVFINNTYAAIELSGGGKSGEFSLTIDCAYNTMLFNWARTNDLGDMGYGFRYMNNVHSDVHHCIIGTSTLGGLDRARIENSKDHEKMKKTGAENNAFFLNTQGDLVLPGGAKWLLIRAKDFEDREELYKYEGNTELSGEALKGKINEAYLNGFISANNSESVLLDRNSPVNQFRSAFGMNLQAEGTTRVDMFANRYPLTDALKLFGAVEGKGAQMPK